jgi:membrane-bound lytic murein transglycosylase A
MRKTISAAAVFLLLSGCATPRGPLAPPPPKAVERLAPEAWPELIDDLDAASLELAASRLASYLEAKGDGFVVFGKMKVGRRRLKDTLEAFVEVRKLASRGEPLNRALRERFDLYKINRSSSVSGHFSAYYAPTIPASAKRTEEYRYPLYAKPKDLIAADLGAFNRKFKGQKVFGRIDEKGRFVPYFDRRAIDIRDALKGRGLEIAWLKSGFDRLNIHIQGSGILAYPDGSEKMARFAATNGAPYASVGLAVVGSKAMRRDEINAETLRRYLEEHPEGEAWLLARNPRYTFFSLTDLPPGGEPSGTTGGSLVAGRSIAIDPKIVPFGALAFASLPLVQVDEEGNLLGKETATRFLVCADTGGAIKGPGRVDLYLGHGPRAKGAAHNVWEHGELYVLLKKLPPRVR